jgi:2-polyprenyl-3-methyl-5-hydroxy-6-metoxy-1,4-benzoquinol methylase
MGYMREKYTRDYYLHKDSDGNPLPYGVAGIAEFQRGHIREADFDILQRIDFRGKRVLDLGCGRGEALKYAVLHGAVETHGVDFSEAAIAIAGQFLQDANIDAQLHCSDALDFLGKWEKTREHQYFDVVTMFDCVEHIPRAELSSTLTILLRLMSRRGILAINTPAFGADNDVIVEGLNPAARDGGDECEGTRGMHCNRYTCYSLKRYLRHYGFAAVSHHLFVPCWRLPVWLEGTRWARRRAAKMGYPLILPRALDRELYTGITWLSHPAALPLRWFRAAHRACVPRWFKRLLWGIMPSRLKDFFEGW